MKVADVIASDFSSWYPHFEDITFESVLIDLDKKFIDFLLEDGIMLPKCCQEESSTLQTDDSDWSDQDEDNQEDAIRPDFPEMHSQVKEAISRLGGAVFVKLNWSSPKDANWMLPQGLKCFSFSDIIHLLKSSDFVTHDLTAPFEHCADFTGASLHNFKYKLVLRRWADTNPLHEFRCFVRQNHLVGISQRDCTSHIPGMEDSKDAIIRDLSDYYDRYISGKYSRESFVFDVWRPSPREILLVDLNPFGVQTDSLLFDWDELKDTDQFASSDEPEFRFVDSNRGIQPSTYGMYKVPIEALVADQDFNNGCSG